MESENHTHFRRTAQSPEPHPPLDVVLESRASVDDSKSLKDGRHRPAGDVILSGQSADPKVSRTLSQDSLLRFNR